MLSILGRCFVWLDTGTYESLFVVAMFVETFEKRQGYNIACHEEKACSNDWLSTIQALHTAEALAQNSYGHYLKALVAAQIK